MPGLACQVWFSCFFTGVDKIEIGFARAADGFTWVRQAGCKVASPYTHNAKGRGRYPPPRTQPTNAPFNSFNGNWHSPKMATHYLSRHTHTPAQKSLFCEFVFNNAARGGVVGKIVSNNGERCIVVCKISSNNGATSICVHRCLRDCF